MKERNHTTTGQEGISLIIALIALVIISLAAAALIRNIDTATLISGNLAFKQAATNSGENAVIQANRWILNEITANSAVLNNDSPANGYYATTGSLAAINAYNAAMTHYEMMSNDATWTNARSAAAVVADCNGNMAGNEDCSGNRIRYIIERMCANSGEADESHCLLGGAPPNTNSFSGKAIGAGQNPTQGSTSSGNPVYRVTARIVGPRNSISYVQSFVY